jgi:hypothetical protein
VVFEAGETHRFWNAGEEDLLGTGYIQPLDNIEYLLSAIYESQRESAGSRPDPLEMAYLMRRYRSQFGMAEIPSVVQRVVFPVVVAVGRLLGKYEKCATLPNRSGGERSSGKPRNGALEPAQGVDSSPPRSPSRRRNYAM